MYYWQLYKRAADPKIYFAADLHQQQSDNVKGQESCIFYFFILYIDQRYTRLSCTSAEETGGLTGKRKVRGTKRFKVQNLFLLYLRVDNIFFYALFLPIFANAVDFLLIPVLVCLCSVSLWKLWLHFLFIKGSV